MFQHYIHNKMLTTVSVVIICYHTNLFLRSSLLIYLKSKFICLKVTINQGASFQEGLFWFKYTKWHVILPDLRYSGPKTL